MPVLNGFFRHLYFFTFQALIFASNNILYYYDKTFLDKPHLKIVNVCISPTCILFYDGKQTNLKNPFQFKERWITVVLSETMSIELLCQEFVLL